MRLLFDANLSPDLTNLLADLFPNSEHVYHVQEESAEDRDIWDYALEHGFAIVTKDADFGDMSAVSKNAPKIVWIRRGNCPTSVIEEIIRANADTVRSMFDAESSLSVLVLL